jgi:hypothetical protein
LEKALSKLADAPGDFGGFDVATMKQEAAAALAVLVDGKLPDPRSVKLRKAPLK